MEQVVHVRVADVQTGAVLPCRLRIRDASGQVHVPLGYLHDPSVRPGEEVGGHLVEGGKVWVYVDGSCEVRLPPGRVCIEVRRGLQYTPIETVEDRGQGRIAIRIGLGRAIESPPGWCWADTRAHWLSPAAAALEGAAEGLELVHVLATRWDTPGLPRLANLLDFSGQQVALERHGCKVVVNTYQRGGAWGDLALLHCHRVVFPLVAGEPGFEHYTLADWCYQCHRKGGLVVWPDFPGLMGERLPLALLGEIDAIEWSAQSFAIAEELYAASGESGSIESSAPELGSSDSPSDVEQKAPVPRRPRDRKLSGLDLWYALLNTGRPLAIVGASGKLSNATPLGAVRTATYLATVEAGRSSGPSADGLTLANWVAAVKRGQTYATSNPVLRWQVNGEEHVWRLTGAGNSPSWPADTLNLHAEARSVWPFSRLELICGGQVLATAVATSFEALPGQPGKDAKCSNTNDNRGASKYQVWRAELSWRLHKVELAQLPSNWLALRCWSENLLVAHTSPIWISGTPRLSAADRELLEDALRQSEATVVSWPHPRRDQLLQRLKQARRLLAQATAAG